jgi:hypothetical protein
MYVNIHIHTYRHTYIHTCIRIYIHAHTIHTLQYDAMAMVGYRDDKDCFLVDFEQKRWDQVCMCMCICVCARARA